MPEVGVQVGKTQVERMASNMIYCSKQRDKFIDKYGANAWYRFHGTLDYTWIGLVTIGLIVNPNRILHIAALATFWSLSFIIFYLPRWIKR